MSPGPRQRYGYFRNTLLVSIVITLLPGCASTKPPPEPPFTVSMAQRATDKAAKLSQAQNWSAAAREWQTAADQYHLLNDQAHEAVALHNLAQAKRELGKLEEARQLFAQAAKINEELKHDREEWRNQVALLQVEAQLDQRDVLSAKFEKLLPRAGEISDPAIHGLFLNELGLWQQNRHEFGAAQTALKQAEQQFQSAKDDYGVAVVTANRARLCEQQKDFAAALDAWRLALARFEKLADGRGIAAALAGEGRSLLASSGDLGAAEKLLRRAVESYRRLKRADELADTLQALEMCLAAQHRDTEAAEVRKELDQLPSRPAPK